MKDEREEKVKELLAVAEARRRARRFLEDLKKIFPGKSKLQLLPVAFRKGGRIAAEMLIEDIERNQLRKMSVDERMDLQKFKDQLQEQNDCPV